VVSKLNFSHQDQPLAAGVASHFPHLTNLFPPPINNKENSASLSRKQILAPAAHRITSCTLPADDVVLNSPLIVIKGTLESYPVSVLIDCGSSGNFIRADFASDLRLKHIPVCKQQVISLADGHKQYTNHNVSNVELTLQSYSDRLTLTCIPLQGYDVILGMPWLEKHNVKPNWKQKSITLEHEGMFHHIGTSETMEQLPPLKIIKPRKVNRMIRKEEVQEMYLIQFTADERTREKEQNENLNSNNMSCYRLQLNDASGPSWIYTEFSDVFPDDLPTSLPPHRDVEFKIDLLPGHPPPAKSPYRMSPVELDEVKRTVDDLEAHGFIRPSVSPFAAPSFWLKKRMDR
jgi:hypothetical protein